MPVISTALAHAPTLASLPDEPFPWPFDRPNYHMSMGLVGMAESDWLTPDAGWPAQLAHRAMLLEERPRDVVASLPEAYTAVAALRDLLLDHAPKHWPAWFVADDDGVVNRLNGQRLKRSLGEREAPMAMAGATMQAIGGFFPHDFCLLLPSTSGWRLAAGVVCFPSHWHLPAKLGRTLPGIHEPVPGYAHKLAMPVDRLFDSLEPERIVARRNWSLSDDPELFQPGLMAGKPPHLFPDSASAARNLYLRVEHQTLRKMQGCGAILFSIRTHQRPLSALSAAQALHFRDILLSVPDPIATYKGLIRTRIPAVAALEAHSVRCKDTTDRQPSGTHDPGPDPYG
jgi:dimethylamine monooxygenase subunit A